ncbi:MAG: nucleotidyltransferase [Planctomycetes bacterium]|nr:nucleotidyltransferase [Planctomycetota bacterium]
MAEWAGDQRRIIKPSGSLVKGTSIAGGSDVDMLVMVKHDTDGSLEDIYYSAGEWLKLKKLNVTYQNVSLGVVIDGINIDVVPARQQHAIGGNASLYRRKAKTWTQTNIPRQIKYVKDSKRMREIRLVKVWRNLHGLEFPSFALELAVIRALKGASGGGLGRNLRSVFAWLARNIVDARLEDPGNTANDVAEDMTKGERRAIADAASEAVLASSWASIVW